MDYFLSEPRNWCVFSKLNPLAVCFNPQVQPMGLWHFGVTALDRWVAKTVARYTSPAVERPARVLTWAADEHVLGVIAEGYG